MTKEEKLEIYRYVKVSLLADIKGIGPDLFGFCSRLELALDILGLQPEDRYIDPYEISKFKEFFPELDKYRPQGEDDEDGFWFEMDDYESRLQIITKVIEEMESK